MSSRQVVVVVVVVPLARTQKKHGPVKDMLNKAIVPKIRYGENR